MERNEINDGKPLVNDYSASSVEEYLEVMMFLSRRIRGEQGALPRLWYRGQQRNSNLNPSLFRDARTRLNEQGYSKNHLREDYRYQFFRARCNQLVTSSPDSKIEWTELMQHHLVHTRLMDWSESAVTALLFAVEPFLNPNGKNHDILYRRSTITPVVWILDPVTLNDYVYAEFLKHPDFLRDALPDVTPFHMTDEQRERIADEIFRRLEKKKDAYFMKETAPLSACPSSKATATRPQGVCCNCWKMTSSTPFSISYFAITTTVCPSRWKRSRLWLSFIPTTANAFKCNAAYSPLRRTIDRK